MRSALALVSIAAALVGLVALSCTAPLAGAPCPCLDGFYCDSITQTCLVAADAATERDGSPADGDAAQAPADADVTSGDDASVTPDADLDPFDATFPVPDASSLYDADLDPDAG